MRSSLPHIRSIALVAALALLAIGAPARAQTPVADQIHWTFTGPTSVTFDWRGSATSIRYGLTSTYDLETVAVAPSPTPISSAGPWREARLTGLAPNTVYHYSIGGSADRTFRTPRPRGSSDFTIFAEGDIGNATAFAEMAGVQSMIAAERPDFVLMLGDLTYGNERGATAVDRHFNDVMTWSRDAAYMPAWGNHEWASGDDLRNYKGRFDLPNPQTSPGSPSVSCCGEDWYWFDYGNARFIAYPEPWVGAYQDWFNRAATLMAAAQADPAIAYIVTFGHRPAYGAGDHAPGELPLRPFLDTLGVRYGKYQLNLAGHDHLYHRSVPLRGVVHVTAGFGGAGLDAARNQSFTAVSIVHHGALRLRFTAAGIEGTALCGPAGGPFSCAPGSTMDTFFIPNSNPDRPPAVVAPARIAARAGEPVAFAVTASDPDGDAIDALAASGVPSAAQFTVLPGNVEGAFAWTPEVADTSREVAVGFSASNRLVGTATTTIAVAGSDRPPLVDVPATANAVVGTALQLTVRARDLDGDAIASLRMDAGALPFGHGASFVVAPGETTAVFSWTPQTADVRADPYVVGFEALNALGGAGACAIRVTAPATAIEKRVAAWSDDAEESGSGSVALTSSDLELVVDGSAQVVGLRLTALAIPPGATVTNAYVQFKVDETGSGAASLLVRGQAIDHATAFTTATRNVSSRARTAASVAWTPASWSTTGQAGTAQRTPNLAPVIQEVVGRAGWRSGNALALILTGTGTRTAEAFEGDAAGAPLLRVEFTTGPVANRAPVVDAGPDQTIPRAAEAVLNATVTDDGLPSPSLALQWSVISPNGLVSFTGGANVEDTRATFSATGSYTLLLTAHDGELSAADSVRITVTDPPPAPAVVDKRVTAGADDAEESSGGGVSLTSSDLEIVTDGSTVQVVGLRFTGLAIPPGTVVTNAWVQFKTDETGTAAASLQVRGQAVDNAPAFTTASRNVSSRARTTASVAWSPASWSATGQAGAAQRTPNLAPVIQEIVGRAGWRSGNALALIVTGSGRRTAEAFEGDAAGAPLLHVELAGGGATVAAAAAVEEDASTATPVALGLPPIDGKLGARVVPNPARTSATLQLVTAHAGPARIEVFDAAGRRVRVILDEPHLPAGPHTFPVMGPGVADRYSAGVYFYRVQVRDAATQGRFLILK